MTTLDMTTLAERYHQADAHAAEARETYIEAECALSAIAKKLQQEINMIFGTCFWLSAVAWSVSSQNDGLCLTFTFWRSPQASAEQESSLRALGFQHVKFCVFDEEGWSA